MTIKRKKRKSKKLSDNKLTERRFAKYAAINLAMRQERQRMYPKAWFWADYSLRDILRKFGIVGTDSSKRRTV